MANKFRIVLRRGILTLVASALFPLAAGAAMYSPLGPDLLRWPHCPPGPPGIVYAFSDPWPAHFQTSPVVGPSGGNCSLDVVSGSVFVTGAGSAGGVAFATPGEVAGNTYTIAFDLQWVRGTSPWNFSDESGSGDANGLNFTLPYPGNFRWRHYSYTAALGPAGPKPTLFVFQSVAGPQEMRIANMTLRQARVPLRATPVVRPLPVARPT